MQQKRAEFIQALQPPEPSINSTPASLNLRVGVENTILRIQVHCIDDLAD